MPATNTASTLVSSILESTGFVTQSRILDYLGWDTLTTNGFFHSAAVFLFTLSCFGAITSFALFGSYRFTKYLIVCPAIFLFLMSSRDFVEPTKWKLGGADAKNVTVPLGDSKPSVANQIEKPRLPFVFRFYTKLISDLTNGITDLILVKENDQELMFMVRDKTMKFFLTAQSESSDVYKMMAEGLYGQCSEMMDLSLQMADPKFSQHHLNKMQIELTRIGNSNASQRQLIAGQLQTNQARYLELKTKYTQILNTNISMGDATKQFISTQLYYQIRPGAEFYEKGIQPVLNKNYTDFLNATGLQKNALLSSDDKERIAALGQVPFTCKQQWEVFQHAALKDAQNLLDKAFPEIAKSRDRSSIVDKETLCREIGRKIGRDDNIFVGGDIRFNGDQCDLSEVVATFLLRNMISTTSYSKKLQERKDRARLLGTVKGVYLVDGKTAEDQITNSFGTQLQLVKPEDTTRLPGGEIPQQVYDKNGRKRNYIPIHVEGLSDVAFGHQQAGYGRGLLYGIYQYAMNIPYYQGVLLYYLSIVYPFFCLLVLVPGRAPAFMFLPLGWLWVKSWDVGFALVMVMDKILWNLLPNTEVPINAFGSAASPTELPLIIQNAFAVDPTYKLSTHAQFISFALLSVPAITGKMILKAKSSFFEPLISYADDSFAQATAKAQSGYNMVVSNMYRDRFKAYQGAALLQESAFMGTSDPFSEGFNPNNLQTTSANFYRNPHNFNQVGREGQLNDKVSAQNKGMFDAGMEVLGRNVGNVYKNGLDPKKLGELNSNYGKLAGDALKGVKGARDLMIAQRDLAARDNEFNHPYLGSYGYYSVRMRGVIAGADGSGGFEIEDKDMYKEIVGSFKKKFEAELEALQGGVNKVVGGVVVPTMEKAGSGTKNYNLFRGMLRGVGLGFIFKEDIEKLIEEGEIPLTDEQYFLDLIKNNSSAAHLARDRNKLSVLIDDIDRPDGYIEQPVEKVLHAILTDMPTEDIKGQKQIRPLEEPK